METKKVNLSSIAAELGVSVAAVSYALNDRPGVSEQLRDRVRRLTKQRNYEARSPQIALLLTKAETPLGAYLQSLLNALRLEGMRRGCRLLILSCGDLALLENRTVSGALSLDIEHKVGKLFPRQKDIPLICLNEPGNPIEGVSSVRSDDGNGVRTALDHLVDNGHRKIGLLYFKGASCEDRLHPFLHYQRFGCPVELIAEVCRSSEAYLEPIRSLLEKGISALLVSGEQSGSPAYYALMQMGLRIPDDISVICWEYPNYSRYMLPAPTTLEQDFAGIASAAFSLLEKKIRGEPTGNIQVPYKFHVRDSVRNIGISRNIPSRIQGDL